MTPLPGRMSGIVAFFLIAGFVCSAPAPTAAPPAPPSPPALPAPPAATQPGAGKLSFPTFGVEFAPPAATWARQFELDPITIAAFAPADKPQSGSLQVRVQFLDQLTARQQVAEEARKLGAVVEPTTLGGTEAFHVRADKLNSQYISAGRGTCIYQIIWGRDGKTDAPELEPIRASWRWLEPQRPAKHPELDPTPVLLFDRFSVLLPTWARPEERKQDGEAVFDGIHYGRLDLPMDFAATFSLPPAAQGMPPDQIKASIENTVLKLSKTAGPMVWKPLGKRDRVLSDAVIDRTGRSPMYVRKAILVPDAQTRLVLTFSVWSTDPADRAAYEAMEQKIVESIEPVAPAPAR